MGFSNGDRVRTKRELHGWLFGPDPVAKGTWGTVYHWSASSGKYSVRFDDGSKREDLTEEDIEPEGRGKLW
jgi:hypothetical protein